MRLHRLKEDAREPTIEESVVFSSSKTAPPSDMDAMADSIFKSFKAYTDVVIAKRCAALETRIQILEALRGPLGNRDEVSARPEDRRDSRLSDRENMTDAEFAEEVAANDALPDPRTVEMHQGMLADLTRASQTNDAEAFMGECLIIVAR
jgi:hypothetical protein